MDLGNFQMNLNKLVVLSTNVWVGHGMVVLGIVNLQNNVFRNKQHNMGYFLDCIWDITLS